MRRVRVRVAGRVQGVFFRATCARRAAELGVAGWVRNAPDGAVEATFEGPDQAVGDMIEWCRHGPAGARVDHVGTTDESPTGELGFRAVR